MSSVCLRAAGLLLEGGLIRRTSPEALPAPERIAKRRDFLRAYDQGRKEFARLSTVFTIPNGLDHPRLGITVTKKAGKAHDRNRLRRWVREIYRRSRTTVGLLDQGIDLVVNVKPAAAGCTFQEFSEDLKRVLARVSRRAI
jgi:ribonuclease P protein component